MRPALCTAVGALGLFAAADAHADALRLSWTTPAGCPSADDVRRAALRDVDPTRAGEPLDATARVEQAGGTSWREHLTTRRDGRESGERDLEATTCAGLADATAVILALALAPTTADIQPAAPAPRETAPPTHAEARKEHHVAIGVGAAANFGALPSAAPGGVLDLAWTPAAFRLEAEGRLLGAQLGHVANIDAGARFSLAGVGGRACYAVLRRRAFDIAPCAGGDVDVITADGFGAATNRGRSQAIGDLAAGALARVFVVDWLAVRLRAEGVVPLARPSFVVEGAGPVYNLPAIGAAGSLGAEVLFL